MLNLGNHCESNALALAILLVFLKVLGGGRGRDPSIAGGFGFGLLVGFSIWFVYSLAVLPAVLFGFALARDRRLPLRPSFWAALCGVAIGFSPWFAATAGRSVGGVGLYGRTPLEHLAAGLAALPARLFEILAHDLPASVGFGALAGDASLALGLVYWLPLALLACVGALSGGGQRAEPGAARPYDVARLCGASLVAMTLVLGAAGVELGPFVVDDG
jgi:hypothetical protein